MIFILKNRCSFLKHDIRDIAMGSVFLAGKAQETVKKPRDLAYVFDQIFKVNNILLQILLSKEIPSVSPLKSIYNEKG